MKTRWKVVLAAACMSMAVASLGSAAEPYRQPAPTPKYTPPPTPPARDDFSRWEPQRGMMIIHTDRPSRSETGERIKVFSGTVWSTVQRVLGTENKMPPPVAGGGGGIRNIAHEEHTYWSGTWKPADLQATGVAPDDQLATKLSSGPVHLHVSQISTALTGELFVGGVTIPLVGSFGAGGTLELKNQPIAKADQPKRRANQVIVTGIARVTINPEKTAAEVEVTFEPDMPAIGRQSIRAKIERLAMPAGPET